MRNRGVLPTKVSKNRLSYCFIWHIDSHLDGSDVSVCTYDLSIYAYRTTDVVVDVIGYFAAP